MFVPTKAKKIKYKFKTKTGKRGWFTATKIIKSYKQ